MKQKILLGILGIILVAIAAAFLQPVGDKTDSVVEIKVPNTTTQETDSEESSNSDSSSPEVATGNPDDAIDAILLSAEQEATAASQSDDADVAASSDTSISEYEGTYNENEF